MVAIVDFTLCILLTTLLCVDVTAGDGNGTLCAFVDNKVTTEHESGEPIITHDKDKDGTADTLSVVRCAGDFEFCYTLWYIGPSNKTKHVVLKQGCWDQSSTNLDCLETNCVAREALMHRMIRNHTRFCCCRGSLCNINVTDTVNLTAVDILSQRRRLTGYAADPNYSIRTVVIALSSVASVAILICVVFTVVRVCMMHHRFDAHEAGCDSSAAFLGGSESLSAASGSCSGPDFSDLKIGLPISHGRYGDVFRGFLGSNEVAIKVLNTAQYRCFANESDVLSMPLMNHPSIVEFHGCTSESLPGGLRRLLIVTKYEPLGSLTDYLKHNTVDWITACKMCHSIASGLAHLHTEYFDGAVIKPTIAHRDVNSRNVLVKSDLSCCLCDFGFAMKIPTTRITEAGANDDRASLADVGTLRYMAPEVLEGSVNLYDCRMALTQVDVYALGLVFWEIGKRCHELYQGLPTPEYQLPFEAEVGSHPSFAEMQVAISRNKLRPSFPDTWKDTNLAIKALKDTIEECWDHDAEARISAVCAEERTREMTSLWEMRFKGLTPTTILRKDVEVQRNKTVDDSVVTDGVDAGSQPAGNRPSSMLPASETVSAKADCNVDLERSGAMAPPLAPRNAQNPTVERNTHHSSSEELAVEGNTLVVKRGVPTSSAGTTVVDRNLRNPNVVAVTNRPLSALRPDQLQRIAFVQNAVDSTTNGEPKRQNKPVANNSVGIPFANEPADKTGSQIVNAKPCEVIYLEAAGTAVVRPTSLPLEINGCSFMPSNMNIKPPNVEMPMTRIDIGPSRLGSTVSRNSTGAGEQPAVPNGIANTCHSAYNGHCGVGNVRAQDLHKDTCFANKEAFANGTVQSNGQVYGDNLGFEASTSPRFDINEASCEV